MRRWPQKISSQVIIGVASCLIVAAPNPSSARDNLEILDDLQQRTLDQCERFYPIRLNDANYIDRLQQAPINEKDKFACAFPYVWRQIKIKLNQLETLDPASPWQNQTYVTLAARIYNFDFLIDTPQADRKLEIMSVHPDLLILHRIMRQVTPYALALVFHQIGKTSLDFVRELRATSASASEITPWSAHLRLALGLDCYGPHSEDCQAHRRASYAVLKSAIALLKNQENLYGYVSTFSKTLEANEAQFRSAIQISRGLRDSLLGQSRDFLMGPRASTGWKQLHPDLRDTLNYLSSHEKDSETSTNKMILLNELNCKTIYRSLAALAREENNSIQSDFSSFNPMQLILRDNPHFATDHLAFEAYVNSQDCSSLNSVQREFGYRGLLSRFQRYQAHIFLLSSHDDGLGFSQQEKQIMKRFALLLDIENVVNEFEKLDLDFPETTPNARQTNDARSLLEFAIQITKEKL